MFLPDPKGPLGIEAHTWMLMWVYLCGYSFGYVLPSLPSTLVLSFFAIVTFHPIPFSDRLGWLGWLGIPGTYTYLMCLLMISWWLWTDDNPLRNSTAELSIIISSFFLHRSWVLRGYMQFLVTSFYNNCKIDLFPNWLADCLMSA